jgi:hypothetical protein
VEKKCTKCDTAKPIADFGKDKKAKSGYKFWCKSCSVSANKQWRADNPNKSRELDKKYRESNKEKIRIKNQKRYQNLTLDQKFEMLVKTAQKRKNFKCLISADYLKTVWQIQEGRCAYTKLPLTADANQLTTMSLDRINSDLDYVEGNIQLVCVSVNRMKSDFPEKDFVWLCNLITQNNTAPDYPTELARIP